MYAGAGVCLWILKKFLRTPFLIGCRRWLLLHRVLQTKIKNAAFIFRLPRLAVHNPKLSQEMCFILPVYYTELCTGRSTKEANDRFFGRVLERKVIKKVKFISCHILVWHYWIDQKIDHWIDHCWTLLLYWGMCTMLYERDNSFL